MRTTTRVGAGLGAVVFAGASAFFLYYSVRLAIVWTSQAGRPASGAYIGAVVFPVAVIVFGWLARRCYVHAFSRPSKLAI